MEVHHHPNVEKKGFKEYFLEFLMIFLAVNMGFIAESLRENIVERTKEHQYIQSFYEDLNSNGKRIQDFILYTGNQIISADSLLYLFKKPVLTQPSNDIYFHVRR